MIWLLVVWTVILALAIVTGKRLKHMRGGDDD